MWIQLHRVNWHACLKNPESQLGTRSPPLTRLCLQTVAYPTTLEDTYALLQQTELLAGVINEQDCRAIRTACCCLKSLRIRVEVRANVTERAVISRQLQLMQASVQSHHTEDLDTADTSCPSRTSLIKLVPVQGIEHYRRSLHC